MGQSIEKPKRNASLRVSHSRSSIRSNRQSSNCSRQQSLKNSRSASKVQQNNQQKPLLNVSNYLTSNRNQELGIISNYDQKHKGIKKSNQIKNQKISLGGQGSQLSPNFRELNEVGAQYGLSNLPNNNHNNKPSVQASSHHRDHHNDITISFSKTKNLINNPFHEQSELKKQNMRKILQDSIDHGVSNLRSNLNKSTTQYLQQQLDKISSTKSICSEDCNPKTEKQADNKQTQTPYQQNQIIVQKNKINQNKIVKKQQKNIIKLQQKNQKQLKIMNNTVSYNDYDLNSFSNNNGQQNTNIQQSKKIKLSKKMQELKAKIASKIVKDSKQKQSILKSCVRRLSKSLQKSNSNHDYSQEKSIQRFKSKNNETKISYNDTKIIENSIIQQIRSLKKQSKLNNNQYQFVNNNQGKIKESDLNKHYKQYIKTSECQERMSNFTFQKPVKEQPKKLIIFGNKNSFQHQNATQNTSKPSKEKDKKITISLKSKQQQSFTQMVKKQHFSNKNKKYSNNTEVSNQLKLSHAEHNKFSPVTHNFYNSTCHQKLENKNQYEFFDENDQKQRQNIDKLKKQQQILSLKQITHKLTNKQSKIQKRGQEMKQFQNLSTSQEQSIRNKTYCEKNKSINNQNLLTTSLNYTEMIGNCQQYMIKDALNRQKQGYQWAKNQRKKHKSLDNTSKFNGVKKSKLLVF